MEGLELVLKESDFLVLTVPLTPETRGLIGAKELALMKPTAILVNVARARRWMRPPWPRPWKKRGHSRAGLDVFATEPLPADLAALATGQLHHYSHCAAQSPQYASRATDLFCRNLDAYQRRSLADPGQSTARVLRP